MTLRLIYSALFPTILIAILMFVSSCQKQRKEVDVDYKSIFLETSNLTEKIEFSYMGAFFSLSAVPADLTEGKVKLIVKHKIKDSFIDKIVADLVAAGVSIVEVQMPMSVPDPR